MILDIRKKLLKFVNRPPNPAIAETAVLQVTASPDAEPGVRELRLETPARTDEPLGLSGRPLAGSREEAGRATTIFPGSSRSAS